ncbi:hypothetical protein DEM26_17400 [Thioclava sp. NG1]|uniref:hypothetical protein n=1 Tax=Thioclava sp. NG1 TaxID=2182426 RepID=UPI000D610D4C|nr:hypothetical protein [Thioclava sp. NG1]PWE48576.1 hypothetical protein DEM26_17400 [Thioclava sp. NG1]
MTYTITDAATVFATLDNLTDEENRKRADKALRHLTQRHAFPPEGRAGRADTYSMETICALRLAQKASAFGLDRWQLERLIRFLLSTPRTAPGRTLSLIGEGIYKAEAGQVFGVSLVMYADGRFACAADWPSETPEQDARVDSIFESADLDFGPEDCRFQLCASRLISELLTAIRGMEG